MQRGDSVGLIVGGIEEVLEGTFDDKGPLRVLPQIPDPQTANADSHSSLHPPLPTTRLAPKP